jgi:hypothetical protein
MITDEYLRRIIKEEIMKLGISTGNSSGDPDDNGMDLYLFHEEDDIANVTIGEY